MVRQYRDYLLCRTCRHDQVIPVLPYGIGFPFIISIAFLMYERLLNNK